jgi:hypothetical protein
VDSTGNNTIPGPHSPPTLVLDIDGVTAWLGGEPAERIRWAEIEEIRIVISAVKELEYSEAFWILDGTGQSFAAPRELVVNGELLTKKLLGFPGFSVEAYRCALEAEATAKSGEYLLWRRSKR